MVKSAIKVAVTAFLCLFPLMDGWIVAREQPAMTLDTRYYPPKGEAKEVALMLLAGSDGGYGYFDTDLFSNAGYPCLAVAYFGTPDTPQNLVMIPLEYFESAITYFLKKPELEGKKLVVYGYSKGGELALLLASRYPQITGVIARVPSSVVFQGLGQSAYKPDKSSWSIEGIGLPFVPYVPYDYSKQKENHYLELYTLSLRQADKVSKAIIPVEQINGPLLLVSAQDDTVWPSTSMCDAICSRLKESSFPHPYKHLSYENCGHTISEYYLMGGSREGNKKARIDMEREILHFLDKMSQ